jgi:sarcosine oxidase
MSERYDVAVVGLGLFGAAALRHLTRLGARTVGIGPGEPENWDTHDGVFASHYDSGRITRRIDRRHEWAALAARSIEEYGPLEDETGIEFHHPVGTLWADTDHARVREIERVARSLDITCHVCELSAPASVHGYSLPSDVAYTFEADPAGYVDPRKMLAAQLSSARKAGAHMCADRAIAIERNSGSFSVLTAASGSIEAESVILATGAYANAYGLTRSHIPLRVKSEITALFRVDGAQSAPYHDLPTFIYGLSHPTLSDFYLVPPTTYPDGSVYLKAGADTSADLSLTTREKMNEWMRNGPSDPFARDFDEVIRAVLPTLPIVETHTKRCLITYTAHGLPYIDQVEPGLFVALGGNGRGAKSSDAIGRAAAALALGNWDDPLPQESFSIPSDAANEPAAMPL